MKQAVNIMWFRRDIRLEDNAALYYALKDTNPVIPIFIFDRNILDDLEEKADRRVEFIRMAIEDMQEQLVTLGSTLEVFYSKPEEVFKKLLEEHTIEKVFTNADYEEYAIDRDKAIRALLEKHKATLHIYKDQVIFDGREVLKDDGTPYTVFTPYSKRWKATLTDFYLKAYPTKKYFKNFYRHAPKRIPSLESMGFKAVGEPFPAEKAPDALIKHYSETRDYPGEAGTSRMGIHLRFGTISIRQLATRAKALNETYLNELIWRDFYHAILWHFPHVRQEKAFKPAYDNIKWRYDEKDFKRWCEGQTGYPIVDAGMRELNATGYMHNRVRMITASFLSKHLLIDWRWGEAYFAKKLLDFDYAANNGGWQWSAGCGCDAAPYFRIFNPTTQTQKFDKDLKYVRKWVPEFESLNYPKPMVVHEQARERCLKVYKEGLNV